MAKLSDAQVKANRFDAKRDKNAKVNRDRKRFKAKVNAPFTWYVFPDWGFSHRRRLKKAESIIVQFPKSLSIEYIAERLFIAFGNLNNNDNKV